MARSFNGTTDKLTLASALKGTVPLSMACFFISDGSSYNGILSVCVDGNNNNRWTLNTEDTASGQHVTAQTRTTANAIAISTATYSLNTWQHAAAVFAAANSRSIYLNGGNKATETTSRTPSGMNATMIGSANGIGFAKIIAIAEIGFWGVALTDAEVALLASGVPPYLIRPASLLAYIPVLGGSPETDFSGNGKNFTIVGTPAIVDHAPVRPYWTGLPVLPYSIPSGDVNITLGRINTLALQGSKTVDESVSLGKFLGLGTVGKLYLPPGTVVVQDTFTDTNGTALTSHTPDTDLYSSGWQTLGALGSFEINTNKARANDVTNGVQKGNVIDTRLSDIEITATITINNSLNVYANGIVLRYTDASNYYYVSLAYSTNSIQLFKREAGVTSVVLYVDLEGSVGYQGLQIDYIQGATLTITVRAEDDRITIIYGGMRQTWENQTLNQFATVHGIIGTNSSSGTNSTRIDDLTMNALPAETIGSPVVWLHAENGVYKSNGSLATALNDVVATWVDKSNRGFSGSQHTAANRPVYKPTEYNGYPAIFFDGTNDAFYFRNRLTPTDGVTLAILFRIPAQTIAPDAHNDLFRHSAASSTDINRLCFFMYDSPRNTEIVFMNNVSVQLSHFIGLTDDDTWHILTWAVDWNAGTSIIRVDGTTVYTQSTSITALVSDLEVGSIGAAVTNSYEIQCYIREYRIYDTAMDATALQTVEAEMLTNEGTISLDKFLGLSTVGSLTVDESISLGSLFGISIADAAGPTTYFQTFSGAISPSGLLLKNTQNILSGALTPGGSLLETVSNILSGSVSPSGQITNIGGKTLAGSVSPQGVLANEGQKSLSGSITPTGAFISQPSKILSGNLSPTGSLAEQTGKSISGSITPTGTIANTLVKLLLLVGSITPSGVLSRITGKQVAGFITPTGAITKSSISKNLTGAITPVGLLVKRVSKTFAGGISPTGTIANTLVKLLTVAGFITPTGALTRLTGKRVSGSATPTGTLASFVGKILTGSITPAGSLVRGVSKIVQGALGMAGNLVNLFLPPGSSFRDRIFKGMFRGMRKGHDR